MLAAVDCVLMEHLPSTLTHLLHNLTSLRFWVMSEGKHDMLELRSYLGSQLPNLLLTVAKFPGLWFTPSGIQPLASHLPVSALACNLGLRTNKLT